MAEFRLLAIPLPWNYSLVANFIKRKFKNDSARETEYKLAKLLNCRTKSSLILIQV